MRSWFAATLRIPWAFMIWTVYSLLWLPLFIAGLPIVGYFALTRKWHYRNSKVWVGRRVAAFPDWAQLYNNEEDGVLGTVKYREGQDPRWRCFAWSALRNPVNYLRFVSPWNVRIEPGQIHWVGNSKNCRDDAIAVALLDKKPGTFWYFAWQGWRPVFRLIHTWNRKKYSQLYIGWKIQPKDNDYFPVFDYRYYGAGFAHQIGWYRDIL